MVNIPTNLESLLLPKVVTKIKASMGSNVRLAKS